MPRSRLVERLDAGLRDPLTLVSAPAGYGKTTLMSEWRAGIGRDFPAAWLSLDAGDNDLERFLNYLAAALETIKTGLMSSAIRLIQPPQLPPLEAILTALVNDLDGFPQDFVLVLDDYHVITTPAIHEAVTFILDHLPPQLHLVILTRSDPPLSLARLRARNQLAEIRADHLRLTPGEAAVFLNKVMDLRLSADDIAALETRTEGWIAGLQLAALSMQGRDDVHDFVSAFAGSHRYIVDYLAEEVLNRQPDPVRSFLLQTSILDRLTGPLCDALTGRMDGQPTLEALERANLFVVPLDGERRWYRYHRLFADLLRNRLRHDQSSNVAELHRRASAWFEANGQIPEAMDQALAGEHFGQAARIIEQVGNSVMAAGGWGLLLSWLRALPAELVHSRPALELFYAWGLVLTGQLDDIERHLSHIEYALSKSDSGEAGAITGGMRLNWRGQVAAIRGRAAYLRGEVHQAIESSREALELLPEGELTTRGILAMNLGLSYISTGDLAEASRVLEDARIASEAAGNLVSAVEAAGTLAQLQEFQGHLQRAAETYREILRLAGDRIDPNVVAAHLNLGNVLYEWYDLDGAQRHLQAGLSIAQKIHMPDGILFALLWLARVKLAWGDREGSAELLQQAELQARNFPESILNQYTAALMARLALARGEEEAAARWAARLAPLADDALAENFILRKVEYMTRVRLLIAQGRLVEAGQFLEKLQSVAESTGLAGSLVEILALRALTRQGQGDTSGAMRYLAQALQRAEPEGYTRTFVDLGEPMAELLRLAQSPDIAPGYVTRLLSAMTGTLGNTTPAAQPLIEPLSERELQVLRLVAAGKSNRQIADELVIATGTVKKHLSNIFGKLNAQSRTQCVARARELQLLK